MEQQAQRRNIQIGEAQEGDFGIEQAILAAFVRRCGAMQDHRLNVSRGTVIVVVPVGVPGDRLVGVGDVKTAPAIRYLDSHHAVAIGGAVILNGAQAEASGEIEQRAVELFRVGRRRLPLVERGVGERDLRVQGRLFRFRNMARIGNADRRALQKARGGVELGGAPDPPGLAGGIGQEFRPPERSPPRPKPPEAP